MGWDGKRYLYSFECDGMKWTDIPYEEYLKNGRLMEMVGDPDRVRLFLGSRVYSYTDEWLKKHEDVQEWVRVTKEDFRLNKLKYFCPHSVDKLKFLNTWDEDIISLVAPNRVGKTTCGVVKAMLSGLIECDPEWPIFKENGVKWRKFRGGGDVGFRFAFGSYEWSSIKTVLWPRVREYVPDDLLGNYGTKWQNKKGMQRRREPNFERSQEIVLLNGNVLKFHAYSQSQANYESDAYNGFMYDEQPPMYVFDAVDERTRTLKGKHFFTLTPHKVEGRQDTGGGTPLHRLLTGEETRGHTVASFNTSLLDVPDWIYPESEKMKAFNKWIHEPAAKRNTKMLKEGRSRVLGEWHMTSGIILDEWERKVHVIDDFEVPDTWTRYRALDHGITNPTVCLWIAVSPPKVDGESDIVVYREYYSVGKTINENVVEIVKMSGNERKLVSRLSDSRSGNIMPVYSEDVVKEWYAKSVLDSRSFALTDTNTGKPYGYIYKSCGLPCGPASGKLSQHWIPILKELLQVDYDKKHPFSAGIMGRAKMMVMRSCVNLVREIEGWIWEEYRSGGEYRNAKETPRKKDDHGCTALGYACQIPLRYRGDLYKPKSISAGYGSYTDEADDGEYRPI